MEIALFRIDSRLVHGQVIESWIPFTGASKIIVVDDRVAADLMFIEVMKMAVPPDIDLHCSSVDDFISGHQIRGMEDEKALVLCRDLKVAMNIVARLPKIMKVNVGNLHYEAGKRKISPTVFFDSDDEHIVKKMKELGIEVDVKAVPTDCKIEIELK